MRVDVAIEVDELRILVACAQVVLPPRGAELVSAGALVLVVESGLSELRFDVLLCAVEEERVGRDAALVLGLYKLYVSNANNANAYGYALASLSRRRWRTSTGHLSCRRLAGL